MNNVLIIGHSFISRLDAQLTSKDYFDVNFHLAQCNVRCFGKGGSRIDTLRTNQDLWTSLENFQPSVVIIQVGGNDICNDNLKLETIACDMTDFVKSIMNLNYVQAVVVCELFKRTNPRGTPPDKYERNRNTINSMLPILLEDELPQKAIFWKHLRLPSSHKTLERQHGMLRAVFTKKIAVRKAMAE